MQTATVYQEQGSFLPKEYTFKIQKVKVGGSPSDWAGQAIPSHACLWVAPLWQEALLCVRVPG